jgi:hypothetical protein
MIFIITINFFYFLFLNSIHYVVQIRYLTNYVVSRSLPTIIKTNQ